MFLKEHLFVILLVLLLVFFLFISPKNIESFRRRFRIRHIRPYRRRFRNRHHINRYWNNTYYRWPYFLYNPFYCSCKRGCTPEGCVNPGTGINDCVWASDCNCC